MSLDFKFDIKEHIINQLAFSRLASTPLPTILSHLPREAGSLTKSQLRDIIDDMPCVGEVVREGKDAAGKILESEYYYMLEKDEDEKRKELVANDLRKPGLRECRKQHKVRFTRCFP
jgi:regulator of nonsense transcripts 2